LSPIYHDHCRGGGGVPIDLLTELNPPGLPVPPRYQDIKDVAEMRLDWARERFADPRYTFADPRYTNDIASIKNAEHVLDALIRTTRTRHLPGTALNVESWRFPHRIAKRCGKRHDSTGEVGLDGFGEGRRSKYRQ
jgi:hypothetical protein